MEASINAPDEVKDCVYESDKRYIPLRYPIVYDEGAPPDYYTFNDAEKCLRCGEAIIR